MNRVVKTLLIIVGLLLASALVPLIVIGAPYVGLDQVRFLDRIFLNMYFWQYLFWIASAFAILILIGIVFVVFYPRLRHQFNLDSKGGHLVLEQKAIEGFVRSKLATKDFISKPKIKVHATKRKIRVTIDGQLKRTSSLIDRTEAFRSEIQQELQRLLGTKEQVIVNVDFNDYQTNKQTTDSTRVV
ncbi:alkaline shock response membrane anchor protein AmaP [Lapidilactobacillus mulanensis]|uniref:Alkaline shock response membrane anchor protein AmaP n=1 Tax=Lapidilactobacillus mulanensis TaxID=2485999 RepID=A0ABW4DIM1_9LACO|nr:alkaline shock response membrane anchor protein AmaP [Lapidilactobacillus mulanensis]